MDVVSKSWFEYFVLRGHSGHEGVDLKEIITGVYLQQFSVKLAQEEVTWMSKTPRNIQFCVTHIVHFSYSQYIFQHMHFLIQYIHKFLHVSSPRCYPQAVTLLVTP
jgi:hypothetical protein